jgi:hypothetical protein
MQRRVLAVTGGETIGLMIPAAVGGLLRLATAPGFVVQPMVVGAGACEGALLWAGKSFGFGSSVVRRPSCVAATDGCRYRMIHGSAAEHDRRLRSSSSS